MTGEKRMFSSCEKNHDPQRAITFGDGNQGLVKGLGKIAISPDHSISNVFLVDSLDYNLLSVSQLYKMGYSCLFTDIGVTVFRRSDDSVAFKGLLEGQLYLVDFNRAEIDTCLIANTNMGWLWHRRLAHVGMKNLHKLLKGEHILGLTNVHFEKDMVYSACQAGKQVGVHHPHKNIMTTDRPLELLHMDLFGPIAYISIDGSRDGNGDFPVGEWLPIPIPVGTKIPRLRPRERSRGSFFSHPHPRRGIYPRGEPRGESVPAISIIF
jgi:hypothetical protein